MIEIKDLSFNFENTNFFENINLSLKESCINVIIGPNGAGKTTLIKLIAGILKPDCGVIKSGKKMFYLPQKITYTGAITLYEYLTSIFFRKNWKWHITKNEKQKIFEIMQKLEIYDKKDIAVEKLSAGELQKANIALGLLSEAEIFLLDEPTSNMDLINQVKVLDIIKKLSKNGITSVVILHDLNLAAFYGDYFIGINQERKIFSADKKDFLKSEILKKIYNINFKIINDNGSYNVQIIK